jgi:GntR family transcriptional repressor for pyruvate dehydrogenase complex
LRRLAKTTLADAVIEEMKRMIESGELKEGDKLPNQPELAARLGVSRASLREALHTLSLIGVIEQHPGLGTVVTNRVPEFLPDHLSLPLVSDEAATYELLEARQAIEVAMAELAVQRITDEEIRQMDQVVEEMNTAVREGRLRDYINKDAEFHQLIMQAAGNRYLWHSFLTIRRLFQQFLEEAFSALPWMLDRSSLGHARIYDAIKARDAKKARNAMASHISDVCKAIKRYYESRNEKVS